MSRMVMALMVCALMATDAFGQSEKETRQQLYDVRDLAAALMSTPTAPATREPELKSPFRAPVEEAPEESRLEMIVGRLGDAMSVSYEWLDEGLLIAEGSEQHLDSFSEMLNRLRDLYGETYTIELRAMSMATSELPSVGESMEVEGEPLYLTRQSVTRRVSTKMSSERRQSFVAELTPVVGDQSVGFDPQIKEAVSGLSAWVTVGAGEESGEETPVLVRGSLLHSTVSRFDPGDQGQSGLPRMPEFELMNVSERSFSASHRVPFGSATAMAVLDGTDAGESIVLVVTVVKD